MIGRGISGGKEDGTRRSLSSTCPKGRWKRCPDRLRGCERVALDAVDVGLDSDVTILRLEIGLKKTAPQVAPRRSEVLELWDQPSYEG
jgi:hypothetical protein